MEACRTLPAATLLGAHFLYFQVRNVQAYPAGISTGSQTCSPLFYLFLFYVQFLHNISEENASDFQVSDVLDIILKEVKFDDREEMYILDAESENYFLVKDLSEYSSLEEIIQPSIENGNQDEHCPAN